MNCESVIAQVKRKQLKKKEEKKEKEKQFFLWKIVQKIFHGKFLKGFIRFFFSGTL